VEPYQNLANIYGAFGNHEKALEKALDVLRMQPDNVENYMDVVKFYFRLNRLNEAEGGVEPGRAPQTGGRVFGFMNATS